MFPRFVLDQNFPHAPAGLPWPPPIELIPLPEFARHLVRNYEDWEILRELDERGDIAGLITNDAGILDQAMEMVTLFRSHLTLIVTEGVGHNPIRATGLVMVHLQEIAKRIDSAPQVFRLRPGALIPFSPGRQINVLAKRRHMPPPQLIQETQAEIASFQHHDA
ncbi:MAG: hypothetical protein ACYDCQ_14425 [Dehalococcoidia bacterium]